MKVKGFSLVSSLIVFTTLIIGPLAFYGASLGGKNGTPKLESREVIEARDAKRRNDLLSLVTTITYYRVDTLDLDFKKLEEKTGEIPLCPLGKEIGKSGFDLSKVLVDKYTRKLPMDPKNGTEEKTGYTICKTKASSNFKIKLSAPGTEGGSEIQVER